MKKLILFSLLFMLSACEVSEPVLEEPVAPVIVEKTPLEENLQEPVEEIEVDSDANQSTEETDSSEESPEVKEEEEVFPELLAFDPQSIGEVGIITTISRAGTKLPLWNEVNHVIYNQFDLFDQSEYETIFVAYQLDLLQFFPPSTWGVAEVLPNQIVVTTYENKKVILVHVPESDFNQVTALMNRIDYRILGLESDTSLTEYLEWQDTNPLQIEIPSPPTIAVGNSEEMLSRFEPIGVCQLKTNRTHRDGSQLGFPYVTPFVPNQGVVNVIVAPIDFSNAPGDPTYLSGLVEDVYRMVEWAEFFAGDNMSYNLTVLEEWITYEKGSDYFPDYSNAFYNELQNPERTKVEILELIQQKTDVKDVDMVYLVFPQYLLEERKVILYGKSNLQLQDGTRIQAAFYGNERPEASIGNYWSHLLHETMHFQGFVGHGPAMFGQSYSIMNRDNTGTLGILSWEAFLIDWYDENDLGCVSKENLTDGLEIELSSIDELGADEGLKSLMIRLSDTKIMIIEYRSQGPWSLLSKNETGIITYVIDITKESQYPPPRGVNNQQDLDEINFWYHLYSDNQNPVFKTGSQIIYDDIKLEIIAENRVIVQLES